MGYIYLDTDHDLKTGYKRMGDRIPTYGGDVTISYDFSLGLADTILLYSSLQNPGDWATTARLRPRHNDGRYRISGNQLVLSGSASIFDAWVLRCEDNGVECQDTYERRPMEGLLNVQVFTDGDAGVPPTGCLMIGRS